MTRAERELLFTLARVVRERLGDIEHGSASDREAAQLTASLYALARPRIKVVPEPHDDGAVVEVTAVAEQPVEYSATEAARAYLNKKNGKAAPADDGVLRWANGRPVSAEDQGLG